MIMLVVDDGDGSGSGGGDGNTLHFNVSGTARSPANTSIQISGHGNQNVTPANQGLLE